MDRIGRYKIVRELGRGAMGVVYHAIDPNIGRPVAIKTIHLGAGRGPEEQERMRERLFREARSAGILSHPGIVTIYDVEQQGDVAYIAMEFVDGPTLDHLLSAPEPLPAAQMFSILGQTAVALDYAHQKGIVHRDIKPANIMIAGDGTAKIADFGIAKIAASEQLTMTGSIVGTPHYMSPEQVQGQPVDWRSDQFSLAVIVFEMLTGEKPYTGEHLTTVVYKIVAEEPVPPRSLNASLGGAIEGVLRKALSKKPDARYRTCQEFAEALEAACNATRGWKAMSRGGSLNEPTMAQAAAPAVSLPPPRRARASDATGTAERARRRKSGFLPFLLAILMAAALLALVGWQAAPRLLPTKSADKQADGQRPASSPGPAVPPKPTAPAATASETKPSPMPAEKTSLPAPEAEAKPPVPPPPTPLPPQDSKPVKKAEAAAPRLPARPVERSSSPPRQAAGPQPVTVISSPGGATATLDGRAGAACTTPCALDAMPGRHTIAVTMPGYQAEHREVDVGSGPVELPAVVLRAPGGTLMLSSVPPGAAVLVNGKRITQTTPAQISLAPGSYKITVEKDGKQSTQTVEVGAKITFLRILLEE